MPLVKITIGRLYNLGSYEHVRYELSADVAPGEIAEDVMLGMERILEALRPEAKWGVDSQASLNQQALRLTRMRETLVTKGEDELKRTEGHFVGSGIEYIERCQQHHCENVAKRARYKRISAEARERLDDLGGSAQWKDAKLDWEDWNND